MSIPIRYVKNQKTGGLRISKGFSLVELKSVELSVFDAKILDIPVDLRRKTSYNENLVVLKELKDSYNNIIDKSIHTAVIYSESKHAHYALNILLNYKKFKQYNSNKIKSFLVDLLIGKVNFNLSTGSIDCIYNYNDFVLEYTRKLNSKLMILLSVVMNRAITFVDYEFSIFFLRKILKDKLDGFDLDSDFSTKAINKCIEGLETLFKSHKFDNSNEKSSSSLSIEDRYSLISNLYISVSKFVFLDDYESIINDIKSFDLTIFENTKYYSKYSFYVNSLLDSLSNFNEVRSSIESNIFISADDLLYFESFNYSKVLSYEILKRDSFKKNIDIKEFLDRMIKYAYTMKMVFDYPTASKVLRFLKKSKVLLASVGGDCLDKYSANIDTLDIEYSYYSSYFGLMLIGQPNLLERFLTYSIYYYCNLEYIFSILMLKRTRIFYKLCKDKGLHYSRLTDAMFKLNIANIDFKSTVDSSIKSSNKIIFRSFSKIDISIYNSFRLSNKGKYSQAIELLDSLLEDSIVPPNEFQIFLIKNILAQYNILKNN